MSEQKSLFPDGAYIEPGIPGLCLIPDYITKDRERRLLTLIDQEKWITEIKRRVQHYGYRYGYKPSDKILAPADPLPRWAMNLGKKIVRDKLIEEVPDQMIVNEYEPGQGIASHVDRQELFGDKIVSISLGSQVMMDFVHLETRNKLSLLLKPRSLLLMSGESRNVWMHGIPRRLTDNIEGEFVKRMRRVSITFRNVLNKI